MFSLSASSAISSKVGFWLHMNALSRLARTCVSIEVRFFRRLQIDSMPGLMRFGVQLLWICGWLVTSALCVWPLVIALLLFRFSEAPLVPTMSVSCSHRSSIGFSFSMFLKLKFSASNLVGRAISERRTKISKRISKWWIFENRKLGMKIWSSNPMKGRRWIHKASGSKQRSSRSL